MPIMEKLIEKSRRAGRKLVLPEGHDPRVIQAAIKILDKGIAKSLIVLGSEEEFAKSRVAAGVSSMPFETIDPAKSDLLESFAKKFMDMRAKRGKAITLDDAVKTMKNRLFFGNMLSREEIVDGLVAGSIASTPDMLRSAFMVVGTAPGIKTGSSCFVMDLKTPTIAGESTLLYADSGVNPNPDAEMLVDIAMATCKTHQALQGTQPKVAFLSFSTKGSADHEILHKIIAATEMMKKRVADEKLDILVDGELQGDAALVPAVAAKKCPDSPLKGAANILIFPDLNTGNICYKLTERLAGADAYGPILQGLARPVNDLSRGCSADDIVGVAAITVCQSLVK